MNTSVIILNLQRRGHSFALSKLFLILLCVMFTFFGSADASTILKMDFDGDINDSSDCNFLPQLYSGKNTYPGEPNFVSGQFGLAMPFSQKDNVHIRVQNNDLLNGMDKLYISIWATWP